MSDSSFLSKWKSEGVLVAVVSFLGSLGAFAFEFGYLAFYEVPIEFLEVNLNRVVWAILWLSLPVIFIWWLGMRLYAALTSEVTAVRRTWWCLLGVAALIFIGWKIYSQPFLVVSLLVWPPLILTSWWLHRTFESGKMTEKWPELSKVYAGVRSDQARVEPLELAVLAPLSGLVLVCFVIGTAGYLTAKWERTGWVLSSDQSFLLVRKYGDLYIFKEFDSTRGRLGDRVLIQSGGEKGVMLKKVSHSPLTNRFFSPDAPFGN